MRPAGYHHNGFGFVATHALGHRSLYAHVPSVRFERSVSWITCRNK